MERSITRRGGKVKQYLISYGASLAISLLILFLASLISFKTEDPLASSYGAAMCSLLISSLLSGYFSAKITRDGVAAGTIIGASLALTLTLISVLFFKPTVPIGRSFLLHAGVIALSALGGFIGRKKKGPSFAYRRKKRRVM